MVVFVVSVAATGGLLMSLLVFAAALRTHAFPASSMALATAYLLVGAVVSFLGWSYIYRHIK
jgi:hypothetical protein